MGKSTLQVVPVLVLNFSTLLPLAAQGGQTILHLPLPLPTTRFLLRLVDLHIIVVGL